MEPRIQYAKTSDGVSIAYAVFGDGPPIVYAGAGFDIHLYSSELVPITQTTDTLVGLGWRVIMYDGRGTGSSERDNPDFSLEARLLDLEAVIERAGVHSFALWGAVVGGPSAIGYAVKHSDRVSRLVLVDTYAKGAELYKINPMLRASRDIGPMADEDWEYYTLTLSNALTGFSDSDRASRLAATFRTAMSASAFLSDREAAEKMDVTDLLPLLNVPTLVVHNPASPFSNLDLMRVLASRIPNARLITTEDGVRAIDAFLREGEEKAAAPPELPSGTAVILFADIVDSTALTERLGDAAFRAKARDLDSALRTVIRDHAGTPIEGNSSATASSPSSRARARRSRRRSPAPKLAPRHLCPSTSVSTPAT